MNTRSSIRQSPGLLVVIAIVWLAGASAADAAVHRNAVYPVPGPPVVLITGLDDTTPGMGPGGNCGGVGSMAALCSALQNAGYTVYVASSASGGGAVINNHNAFDPNARSLAHYLSSVVKTPAILVGHSMGGVFARIAVSRYGAAAAGLFTIASPHDGSFGADLIVDAGSFPCIDPICLAIKAVADHVIGQMGSAAVNDLTHAARSADNRSLSPPGVPTWTYAGEACTGPSFLSSYLFPNDGIVGESSAFGAGANLGSTSRSTSAAYHQGTLQSVLSHLCGSAPIELGDSTVINGVLAAAACVQTPGCRTAADVAAAGAAKSKRANHRRHRSVRTTLTLDAGHGQRTSPGAAVTVTSSTTLIATSPFSVSCNGQQVPALPALGGQIYGVATSSFTCSHATLVTATPISLGVLSNPGHVQARLVSHRSLLRITVSATGAISRVSVQRHGRAVHGVKRTRHGARRVTLVLSLRKASQATITATVSGRRYIATIPPIA